MLPKKNRLSTKSWPRSDLKRLKTPNFLMLYKKSDCFSVGIVVSKKVSKRAVDRNSLKRKIYQAIKNTSLLSSTLTLVIVCFPQSLTLTQSQITQELINYSAKIHD